MKRLILMRGLPGSGKSTETKKLAADHMYQGGKSVAVCSTDDYHMIDGKYVFQPAMLGQFHHLNLQDADLYMKINVQLIIIDNTNIKRRDMTRYQKSGKQLGYEVEEIIMDEEYLIPGEEMTQHLIDAYVDLCANRNMHDVPREVIARMAKEFEQ